MVGCDPDVDFTDWYRWYLMIKPEFLMQALRDGGAKGVPVDLDGLDEQISACANASARITNDRTKKVKSLVEETAAERRKVYLWISDYIQKKEAPNMCAGKWNDVAVTPIPEDGRQILVRGGEWCGEVASPEPLNGVALVIANLRATDWERPGYPESGGCGYASWIIEPTSWADIPQD